MKPAPLTLETFAANCHRLILAGWMPCGDHMEMLFKYKGKVYDLSAADLGKLDEIENKITFLASCVRVTHAEYNLRDACNANREAILSSLSGKK